MTIEIATDNEAFYGFPQESVSTPNAGGKCVTDGETSPTRPNGMLTVEEVRSTFNNAAYITEQRAYYTLNSTKTVAVAADTYWIPIDKDTPRSAKLQLLSIGGVAQYGTLGSDVSFYTHWCPLPKKRPEPNDPRR